MKKISKWYKHSEYCKQFYKLRGEQESGNSIYLVFSFYSRKDENISFKMNREKYRCLFEM